MNKLSDSWKRYSPDEIHPEGKWVWEPDAIEAVRELEKQLSICDAHTDIRVKRIRRQSDHINKARIKEQIDHQHIQTLLLKIAKLESAENIRKMEEDINKEIICAHYKPDCPEHRDID